MNREEKARYDSHETSPGDAGYRLFLQRSIEPQILLKGPPPINGHNFESDPGSILTMMLESTGYRMAMITFDRLVCVRKSAHKMILIYCHGLH